MITEGIAVDHPFYFQRTETFYVYSSLVVVCTQLASRTSTFYTYTFL
jgi:hypothetical protein